MISINLSELIWTVINFFLMLFLLKRFLYTPLVRFMDERQARIDAGLEQERQAQAQVRENEMELSAQKAESREEAKRILDSARDAAGQRRQAALSQAQADAEAQRQRAAEQREAQREAEQTQLAQSQPELAELLAKQLLDEE